jgi:hypothetical protein
MKDGLVAIELIGYLVHLSSLLASLGNADLAAQVKHVEGFATGSTSELFGEAKLLLPRILESASARMPRAEKARLREIIAGIDQEFARIGGA